MHNIHARKYARSIVYRRSGFDCEILLLRITSFFIIRNQKNCRKKNTQLILYCPLGNSQSLKSQSGMYSAIGNRLSTQSKPDLQYTRTQFVQRNGLTTQFTQRNGLTTQFTQRNGLTTQFAQRNGLTTQFTQRNGLTTRTRVYIINSSNAMPKPYLYMYVCAYARTYVHAVDREQYSQTHARKRK